MGKPKQNDEEIWQSLLNRGLIRILEDGSVKVCFEREPESADETPTMENKKPKTRRRGKKEN